MIWDPTLERMARGDGVARREVDMKVLVILNEAPDSAERTYNGLRLAGSLARRAGVSVRVFLIGDAVIAAKASRDAASRDPRVAAMLAKAIAAEATVGLCGSCMDARGVAEAELVEGARRSSLEELTTWTLEADRVLVF